MGGITKIYHFLNLTFGLPFLKSYPIIPDDLMKRINVTIVLSGKNLSLLPSRNPFIILNSKRKKIILEHRLRKFVQEPINSIVIINDVNEKSFINGLSLGSHAICSGFNQIFSAGLINHFASFVNFHPSILPLYRGPVPSYWCLKNGEKYSGFTIHEVTKEIDKGPVLFQEAIEIGDLADPGLLDQKIAQQALPVFRDYLRSVVECSYFEKKELLAEDYYDNLEHYKSFPG